MLSSLQVMEFHLIMNLRIPGHLAQDIKTNGSEEATQALHSFIYFTLFLFLAQLSWCLVLYILSLCSTSALKYCNY